MQKDQGLLQNLCFATAPFMANVHEVDTILQESLVQQQPFRLSLDNMHRKHHLLQNGFRQTLPHRKTKIGQPPTKFSFGFTVLSVLGA